jgi:uncharacterized protein
MKPSIIFVFFCCMVSVNAVADVNEGLTCYKKQDYACAFSEFSKAGVQENSNAQLSLALMYASGLGVERDDTKAFELYQKVAVQGMAEAQYTIGLMYSIGRGVKQNDVKAVEWFQ